MSKQKQIFESIICKFLLNLPREEQEDITRISFHCQKGFYYYIDQILKEKQIKDCDRQEFLCKLKQYAPSFLKINPQQFIAKLQENKPVCGAIIFNRDGTKILVIKVRNKFGFPKGKWNQQETPQQCAAREVLEETGLHIHNKLDKGTKIQFQTHGGISIFFVAKNVSQEERFKIDKKEIDEISWMWVDQVKRLQSRFVQRSRIAWSHYQKITSQTKNKIIPIQNFLNTYRSKDNSIIDLNVNPLLNFKLDRKKLIEALFQ